MLVVGKNARRAAHGAMMLRTTFEICIVILLKQGLTHTDLKLAQDPYESKRVVDSSLSAEVPTVAILFDLSLCLTWRRI
jgi:hypothetical protein